MFVLNMVQSCCFSCLCLQDDGLFSCDQLASEIKILNTVKNVCLCNILSVYKMNLKWEYSFSCDSGVTVGLPITGRFHVSVYTNAKFIVICKLRTLNNGGEDSVQYRNHKKHCFLAAAILLFIGKIILT